MNLKEAIEIAKAMETHYKAFAKISEFLTTVSEYSNTAAKSEKRLASLTREIDEMETAKVARQAEIARAHKELADESQKIIDKLKVEAKGIATSVAESKASVSRDIDAMALRKATVTDQMNKEIQEVSKTKAALGKEVSDLIMAKATLEKEFQAIKDKMASLLS